MHSRLHEALLFNIHPSCAILALDGITGRPDLLPQWKFRILRTTRGTQARFSRSQLAGSPPSCTAACPVGIDSFACRQTRTALRIQRFAAPAYGLRVGTLNQESVQIRASTSAGRRGTACCRERVPAWSTWPRCRGHSTPSISSSAESHPWRSAGELKNEATKQLG